VVFLNADKVEDTYANISPLQHLDTIAGNMALFFGRFCDAGGSISATHCPMTGANHGAKSHVAGSKRNKSSYKPAVR
jgi:hypothetical protein